MRKRHYVNEYDKNLQINTQARTQIEADHIHHKTADGGVVVEIVYSDIEHMRERAALRVAEMEAWHKMVQAMNEIQDIAVREARRHELSQLRAELLHENELLMQRRALLQDSSEMLTIELHHAHACLRSKTHRRPIATCRAGNAPNILMSYPGMKGVPIQS
jgi:hypothetical protein